MTPSSHRGFGPMRQMVQAELGLSNASKLAIWGSAPATVDSIPANPLYSIIVAIHISNTNVNRGYFLLRSYTVHAISGR